MALLPQPEASRGILSAIKGAFGLFSDTNKAQGPGENFNPQPIDEYESSLPDEKIVELVSLWKKLYSVYYDPIDKSQQLSYQYWLGNHRVDDNSQNKDIPGVTVDNLIFESLETFLPIATRANPDPLVSADPGELGQKLSHDIKAALVYEADTQKLRRKLARMTRHWALYRLGVAKLSWDVRTKMIRTDIINPRRMVFDKDGYIDEGGRFHGEFIGEKKRCSAEELIEMFPKKKEYITLKVHGKLGTQVEYYEWWYCDTDVFYTLDEEVLGKYKNPHWNYDGKTKEVDPETGTEMEVEVQGSNHFKEIQAPYVFLAVFNVGLHPHDDTSLITQNISIQDLINRRWRQIDRNVEGMNNGMVVSGKSFTEEQASQAANALRRGVAIRVPDGNVNQAVVFPNRPGLPSDVFNNLQDGRNELRGIFGTSGSTPQALQKQDTVRGKILVNQQDTSRIGGGVTEQIEQVADSIYNWWVQMMFVYFDEEHFITTAGSTGGMDLIVLKNSSFPLLKSLNITVKEGSLIPKDPLTQRNEAIDLWSAGAIDPLNFYKKLDFPDPANATQQLILWQMLQKGLIPPQQYLPSFQVAQQGPLPGQPGVGGPAVNPPPQSVPPEGQPVPPPQSPEAVQAQSQQLLGAVNV